MKLEIEAELIDIQKCVDELYEKTEDFQSSELAHLHMTAEWQDADEAEKTLVETPEYKTYIKTNEEAIKAYNEAERAVMATPEYKDYKEGETVYWEAWRGVAEIPAYKAYEKAKKPKYEAVKALWATPEYKDYKKTREVLEATLEYTNQVKLNELLKEIEKLKKKYKAYAAWNAYIELYRTIKITNNKLMRDLEEAREIYKVAKEALNNEK